jgi:DNA repair protein RecO (recombination protein O)
MKQIVTDAIILARTDYGEADRILTVLTPDHGKLRLLAKGVRRVKSKLAGGIELFSTSTITCIQGRGNIGILVSTRLVRHWGHIVSNLDRTMAGYDSIAELNRVTEDQAEEGYFTLLAQVFEALDDRRIAPGLTRFWFRAQLLRLDGATPNLHTDSTGQKLRPEVWYTFDVTAMVFHPADGGRFGAQHIKYLRLVFAGHTPAVLQAVQGGEALYAACVPLIKLMAVTYLRIDEP